MIGPQCGARMLRISLSLDARNEMMKKGLAPILDQDVCLNPTSGCSLANMGKLSDVLGLLS